MHLSKILVIIPFFYMGVSSLYISYIEKLRNQRHRDLDDMRRVPPAIPVQVPDKDLLIREISIINDPKRNPMSSNRFRTHGHIKRNEGNPLSKPEEDELCTGSDDAATKPWCTM
ncbi:hypothetical protein CP533_1484 [Ophiocordyceps camponoti-saundersi (nom. inval.)]|nr:hypothetical protein CP533_1484 [Ophiocordyceps camponoti-saundersi (nom. inval.)]